MIEFKLLNDKAKLPVRMTPGAAGYDLCSTEDFIIQPNARCLIPSGVAMAIPDGWVGLIWPRSGLAKYGIDTLAGVIDSDYRGEVMISLINLGHGLVNIAAGERVAQLIVQPHYMAGHIEVDELSPTLRGDKGFGSTGYK